MRLIVLAAISLPIDSWDLLTPAVEGSLAQVGRPSEQPIERLRH